MMKREYTGIIGEEMARKRNRIAFLTSFAVSSAVTRCAIGTVRKMQEREQARAEAMDIYPGHGMRQFKRTESWRDTQQR